MGFRPKYINELEFGKRSNVEIKQYFNTILKRWWLIVLFVFIGILASALFSYISYRPVYQSSSTLLVIGSENEDDFSLDYSELVVGQQLVKEYKEIIKSRSVLKEVAEKLEQNSRNIDELYHNIEVTLKPDTRILTISVKDSSPEMAKIIADRLCDAFIKRASELTRKTNIAVIDEAEKPISPIMPDYKKRAMIGALAGLLGSLALIFVIEELDDTIKTVDDVEKHLGLKVLATIPTLDIK